MMVSHLRRSFGTFLLVVTSVAVSDVSTDDGGWVTNPEDRLAQPGPCNIAQEDKTLSQDEFLKRYAYSQPVLIRRMFDNELFQTLTRRKALLEGYGDMTVRLSSANSYSYQKQDTTLRHYCNNYLHSQSLNALGNETFYLFGDNTHEGWEDLLEMYNKPLYTLPGHLPALSFGIAGPGSGVPFHFHGPVFAETVWGRKRWFIYPPDVKPSFHPNRTTLHWLKEDYPKVKDDMNFYECTVDPGETFNPILISSPASPQQPILKFTSAILVLLLAPQPSFFMDHLFS